MADPIFIPPSPNWAQQAGQTISRFNGDDFRSRAVHFPDGTTLQPLAQQQAFLKFLQDNAPAAPITGAYGNQVKTFEKSILAGESARSEAGTALSTQERREIYAAGMESSKTQAAIRFYLQSAGGYTR